MIHINTLALSNFMGVRKADFDFGDHDAVLILGDNGQGKSSAMRAIAYCLNEIKKDLIGADKQCELVYEEAKTAHIQMDATLSGKSIVFDHTIANEGERGQNRSVHYNDTDYTNSEVDDLLKANELSYYGPIMLSRQGEGDVTRLNSSQRRVFMSKLLQFDLTEEVDAVKAVKQDLESSRQRELDNVAFKESEIARISLLKETVVTVDATDITQLTEESTTLKATLDRISENLDQHKSLNDELRQLNVDINLEREAVSQAKQRAAAEAERKKHESEQRDKAVELDASAKKHLDIATTESAKLNQAKTSLIEISASLKDAREAVSLASREYNETKRKADLVSKGKCPTCGGDMHDAYKPEEYDLETALSQYDAEKKAVATLEESETLQRDVVARHKSTYDRAKADEGRCQDEAATIRKALAIVRRIPPVDETKLNDLISQKKTLESRIDAIEIADYKSIKLQYDTIQEKISAHETALHRRDEILKKNADIERRVSILNTEIATAKSTSVELTKQIGNYDKARSILKDDLPAFMVLQASKDIEHRMNAIITQVFPTWSVKLSPHNSGLDFLFKKNGGKYHSVNVASGFEKETLSVAFRVALCESYGLSLLILDECDSHSSPERSQKLFEAIFSSGSFDQVFVISHKTEIRDVLENVTNNMIVYSVENGEFEID